MKQVNQNPYQYPIPTQRKGEAGIQHSQMNQADSRFMGGQCLGYEVLQYDKDCAAPLFGALDVKSTEDLIRPELTIKVKFPVTSVLKLTECIPAGKKGSCGLSRNI